MIFRIMLFGFGLALKLSFMFASFKDADFKKRLQNKNFLMQVKMKNENTGRFYKLDKGKIISKGKISPEAPSILIEWEDASTAMKTLLNKDPKVLIKSLTGAITSGKLAVEMEYASTFSFVESVKDMAGVYSGFLPVIKKFPYVNKALKAGGF